MRSVGTGMVTKLEAARRSWRLWAQLGVWTAMLTCWGGDASAQEWAEKMFNTLEHDFGTVARGADTVFRFEITNLYKEDMQILGVRSSCGCTSPSVENPIIKTHEKAYIVAKFNTRTHVGRKGATLTVTFGAPFAAEVQLRVHGNIRSDVVFSPGAIDFGEVEEGKPHEQRVSVAYAGRSNWEIVDITNDNDAFEVEMQEVQRQAGRVDYQLLVRLRDSVPSGYIKDQLTVVTNDTRAETQRIPLYVTASVRPELSVTPSTLVLNRVAPGDIVTKRILVRGREPFRVVSVDCPDNCLQFQADNEDAKSLHWVEVTFTAGDNPGDLNIPIQIVTDRGAEHAAHCNVLATVTAPPAGGAGESAAAASDESAEETARRNRALPAKR
ncbi:MAG: DUF1573 domain-containing protein [Planctomycetales bacterium]|nr:DUF1573 domain-containing protein [Planctomycetales bacterium]